MITLHICMRATYKGITWNILNKSLVKWHVLKLCVCAHTKYAEIFICIYTHTHKYTYIKAIALIKYKVTTSYKHSGWERCFF